jgi:uncharacterized protein
MMRMRTARLTMALGGLLSMGFWVTPGRAQDSAVEPLSAFPQSLLAVRTAAGKVINFKIWMADTPRREQQGLMFVKQMDEHAGMLFLFPGNQPVSMWMKNTYISLDLVFTNAQGKIDYIEHSAKPLVIDIIGPKAPEYAVLELNGGVADNLGIKVGDTLIHSAFKNTH